MTKNNNEWRVKQATFQGYVKASLESINKRLDNHENKLDKYSSTLERLKLKVGIISAGAGAVFAFVWHMIKQAIGR